MEKYTLEKYFDLTQYGVEHDINKYIANGWYIKYKGVTYIILEKEFGKVC